MNGVLLIDKPTNLTSRDVVNKVSKILKIRKVGHTGTLDPLATGVLVLCVGKYTKLVEILTSLDKEYIATVKLGVLTDTLDITGNVIEKKECNVSKEQVIASLNKMRKEYIQQVPIYSAVKVNGRKLYEYARNNEEVILPKRKVNIKEIKLLDFDEKEKTFTFKCLVSKGTYIRSLIKDITDLLGTIGVMQELRRTKQGNFDIENCYTLEQIQNSEFTFLDENILFNNYYKIEVDEDLKQKISNGQVLDDIYNKDEILFTYNGKVLAIYKKHEDKIKPFKML